MKHPEKFALALALALLAAWIVAPGFEPPDTQASAVDREATRAHAQFSAPPMSPYRSIEILSAWDPPAVPAPANDDAFHWIAPRRPLGSIGGRHFPPPVPPLHEPRFVKAEATPLEVTLEWKSEGPVRLERKHVQPIDCTGRSFTESLPPGVYEFRLIPFDDLRVGDPTEWVRVVVPDKWKFTFVMADTTNGVVRIKLEEYGTKGWASVSEKNYRVGDAIGGSGRTLKSVREVSATRTRRVCDGWKHFQPRTATYRVKEIVLSPGEPHRDPAPAWTRDALCRACLDFLQGIRRAFRLRW